jgi:hypothetical protein
MTRLLELIIILFVIILISTFASSLKYEGFVDTGIDAISSDLGTMGLNAISSNPSSTSKTFIQIVPTLDDLFDSNYLKSTVSNNNSGNTKESQSLSARTCSVGSKDVPSSLMATMNSNKNDCSINIDLQNYNFMATTTTLKVYIKRTLDSYSNNSSNDDVLQVVPDDKFKEFLLQRPVVFTINNSKPYNIDWGRNGNRMLFTTLPIKTVQGYSEDNTVAYSLPIKSVSPTTSNFFPNQANDMKTTLNTINTLQLSVKNNPKVDNNTFIEVNVVMYYLKRDDSFGNKVVVGNDKISSSITDNPYINSILQKYKVPKSPFTTAQLQNPTFSITFTLRVGNQGGNAWWFKAWPQMISVGGNANTNCDIGGRGILLVELRPDSVRKSAGPYIESSPINPAYSGLDFTNQEKSGNSINGCGSAENRGLLWIPTGIDVNISYIVSSTMKVITAKFYDPKAEKKHITFAHSYNNGQTINDILGSIRGLDKIYINNQVKKNNFDANSFIVNNIELSYGMMDVLEWYKGV